MSILYFPQIKKAFENQIIVETWHATSERINFVTHCKTLQSNLPIFSLGKIEDK